MSDIGTTLDAMGIDRPGDSSRGNHRPRRQSDRRPDDSPESRIGEPAKPKPKPTKQVERFERFPTAALPEPIRAFVTAGARAIGCDETYLSLPLLAACAAAIGNSRRVQLKRGWSEPSILWAALVGESGTSKTPAIQLVLRPIRKSQDEAMRRHAMEMKEYGHDVALYERDAAAWKRGKSNDPPPERPEEPQAERFVISDTTVESLAPLLLENPRGLLLARDELSGWIGSFDRYAGKGGADESHWLSMHSGESIIVDRKTGKPRTIHVPRALVGVKK